MMRDDSRSAAPRLAAAGMRTLGLRVELIEARTNILNSSLLLQRYIHASSVILGIPSAASHGAATWVHLSMVC